jgi:hypothetical protein
MEGKPGEHQCRAFGWTGGQAGDAADGVDEELGRAPDGEAVVDGELAEGVDAEQPLGGHESAGGAVALGEVCEELPPPLVRAWEEERVRAVTLVLEDDGHQEVLA